MAINKINIQLLNKNCKLPVYSSKGASCFDIYSCMEKDVILKPFDRCLISTGFSLHLPRDYEAVIRPRSGLAINHGITVLNSPGTIDSDYQGEIKIILINLGNQVFTISNHMRMAQMKISQTFQYELEEIKEINVKTERHNQGLGSTGLY